MRIILNESQIEEIIAYEQSSLIEESILSKLMSSEDIEELKRNIKKSLALGVSGVMLMGILAKMPLPENVFANLKNEIKLEMQDKQGSVNMNDKKTVAMNNNVDEERVEALKKCINRYITAQGHSFNEIKFTPEYIIKVCDETGFDLPLLLAQMQIESNFGLNGRRCRETNSPFSVGLYDNGRNVVKYGSQDEAIRHYIRLMQKDYLINGKDVNDLLKPGCFVNKNGDRYASDKGYEGKIAATRDAIIKRFPELA